MLADQEQKIDEAELPVKTKEQLKGFLEGRDITEDQFEQILNRVVTEYQNHPHRAL